MKITIKMALLAACVALAGCGPQKARVDPETQQKLIRENEMRLASLENSVSALNSQVAQINNRVYEVRTKGGQKTSMTVVPITAPAQGAVAAAPVAKSAPAGKKVDPAPKPAPARKKAAAPPAPTNVAGPSGQLSASADIALPPADLPSATPPTAPVRNSPAANTGQSVLGRADNSAVPVPQGNAPDDPTAPPVPILPTSDLSLPPEQPGTVAPQAAQTQQPAAAAPRRKAQAGEQAAYNTALNAARSGRTDEGIRLFRDFLQKYPQGPYTANAEYWIGECLYAQGKFPEAASQFENVNNTYPKHHKNADALLKAGMTLSKMGDKAAAQEKYRTLIANFPNTEAARRARAMGAR